MTPPTVRLLTRTVRVDEKIRLRVTDRGSGVDPASLDVHVDLVNPRFTYRDGIVTIDPGTLPPGAHRVTVAAGDYQETKNMENTGPVLPNTRTFAATVTVR